MSITTPQISTAEELLRAADGQEQSELVRGELLMIPPAGWFHGRIETRLLSILDRFVEEKRLGAVFSGDTGFILERDPDTVRAPDVAFVRTERLPAKPCAGFFEGAPDLAVEILSPEDSISSMVDKILQYFSAGTTVVWLFDPQEKTLTVHRAALPSLLLKAEDTLANEPLLPGFTMAIGALFQW